MTGNDRCLTPFRRPTRPFPALDEVQKSAGVGGYGTLRPIEASVKELVLACACGTFPRPSRGRMRWVGGAAVLRIAALYTLGMATRQRLDENLARAVERGRARAAESGELTPRRVGPIESVFTDEARAIVAEWQRAGGYEQALAAIATADPDLAVQ